jgi:hypothetical protein
MLSAKDATMARHVLVTGEAENISRQKHAIYNNANSYPIGLTWKVDVRELNVSKEEFFENMFFSVEKNGGNSYLYPLLDKNLTVCRYEWHLPWRNRAAQIRLGIVFEVEKGSDPKVGTAYFSTNDGFKEIGSPNNPNSISTRKLNELKHWLSDQVHNANLARHEQVQNGWQFIFYSTGGTAVWKKPFLLGSGLVLVS